MASNLSRVQGAHTEVYDQCVSVGGQMDPADVNAGSLNEPLLITVMDDVLMVSLMVSVLCSPKDASGGDGHSATLHSSSEEKKKKGWGESRQRDTWTQLVYVESCSLHGTFQQKPFNIAT